MENRKFVIIIGESTGLQCLKKLLKSKLLEISNVISVDKRYHKIIKNICKKNKISFNTSNQFKKKASVVKFKQKNQYLLISIFSSLILNNRFLKNFNKNAYNFHPGLLPFYPGKNCVSGALYNKEKYTGVSLHYVNDKIDQGKIIMKKKIKITSNDKLIDLMSKLRILTINMMEDFEKNLFLRKKFIPKKNNRNLAKKFPKKIPNNGLIDVETNFEEFKRLFNASFFGPFYSSWGRCYFNYQKKKKIIINFNERSHTIDDKQKNFIKKISKNKFSLKLKKKFITVLTK